VIAVPSVFSVGGVNVSVMVGVAPAVPTMHEVAAVTVSGSAA
jgi:hypothetical protein